MVKTSEYGKSLEKEKTIKCGMTKLFFPIRHSQDEEVFTREDGKKSTVKNQCFVKRTSVVFDCLWGRLPHKVQMSLCHGSRNSSENHLSPIFYIECLAAYLGRKVAEDDSNNKKKLVSSRFSS